VQLRIFTEPQMGASYDDLLRVAQATEALGFDGFFRSDHYLNFSGDGLPGPTDAWTSLAGLARETSRIRLGTLVSPATFRPPGPLAITIAQVDAMSGGRVEFGFGAGWYEAEHRAYGLPFPSVSERFDRFAEQLEIIDGLWRTPVGGEFSIDGKYYQLSNSPALPKPAQTPRPPIILGGSGKRRSAELAGRFADEYNVAFRSIDETAEVIRRVQDAVGRPLRYSAAAVLCVGRDDAEVRRRARAIGQDPSELVADALGGTPAQVLDKIERFSAIGVSRLYLQTLDLSDLDHLELVADAILPAVVPV
jgi:F420-dependent oxidoreductase-like protein